jgi:hypothetical protein
MECLNKIRTLSLRAILASGTGVTELLLFLVNMNGDVNYGTEI